MDRDLPSHRQIELAEVINAERQFNHFATLLFSHENQEAIRTAIAAILGIVVSSCERDAVDGKVEALYLSSADQLSITRTLSALQEQDHARMVSVMSDERVTANLLSKVFGATPDMYAHVTERLDAFGLSDTVPSLDSFKSHSAVERAFISSRYRGTTQEY